MKRTKSCNLGQKEAVLTVQAEGFVPKDPPQVRKMANGPGGGKIGFNYHE